METVLTIAEFNPLHAGHAHFLSEVRRRHPQALLVCLMSGNFVQRGTPAVADRWTRSGMALLAGADVVLELPALFAVQGAAAFARGAVSTADALGADVLAFGAECGDLGLIRDAAQLLAAEPPALTQAIRAGRRAGLNHGAARQQALARIAPELAPVLSAANNTLGIEYLQAIRELGSSLQPCLVPRREIGGRLVSASAVREALRSAPDAALREWGVPLPFTPLFLEEELYRLGVYRLRTAGPGELEPIVDVSPEVASRLTAAAGAPDFASFQERASTRWLPRARVRRALLNAVLGFTRDMAKAAAGPDSPRHVRLLGLRSGAEAAFGSLAARSRACIVSGYGRYPETMLAEADKRAASLYSVLKSPPEDPAPDQAHRVVKLKGGRLLGLTTSPAVP